MSSKQECSNQESSKHESSGHESSGHEPNPALDGQPVRGLAEAADFGKGEERRPQAQSTGSAPSLAEAKIFRFTPRRHSQAKKNALHDPVRQLEDEEDRRRMQQNVAAAIIILVLVGAGFWLIDHLRTSARIAACIEAGHRNCVPLDLSQTPGR
jgi:hypothetical protein